MSKFEMIDRTRQSLELFNKLPVVEQLKRMAKWGPIDDDDDEGEVQKDEPCHKDQKE